MRRLKVILVVGLLALAFVSVWLFLGLRYAADYKRFQTQGTGYYSRVAAACQSILEQHPMPSVGLSPDPERAGWFSVPADQALPPTIRALNPDVLRVSTNRAYIGFRGAARLHWGIAWFQREDTTNCWALESVGPAERVLYVKYKN
jgi:hypothetical protein